MVKDRFGGENFFGFFGDMFFFRKWQKAKTIKKMEEMISYLKNISECTIIRK